MSGLRIAILLPFTLATAMIADEPVAKPNGTIEERQIAEALTLTTSAAREFSFADEDDTPLKFEPKSLLQWSNPAAGTLYGNVFVWTRDARPQAIASFYQWYSPYDHAAFELHSLSTEPLRARRNAREVWHPDSAGIMWKTLSDAKAPSPTPSRRLIQLRQIARAFSIEKTDREKNLKTLRLLPQPVYRFVSPSQNVVDGAMFLFVQGTDPEVVLLLETVVDPNDGTPSWRYAFARLNSVKFVASFRKEEVWRVELAPWSDVKNPGSAYFAQRLDGTAQ